MDDDQFLKIAEASSESDALMLKAALEAVRVQATIAGLEASALGASLDGMDVIEIFVPLADEDKAAEVLDALEEDEMEIPEWTCHCGVQVDAGFSICWSCQAEYSPPQDAPGSDSKS